MRETPHYFFFAQGRKAQYHTRSVSVRDVLCALFHVCVLVSLRWFHALSFRIFRFFLYFGSWVVLSLRSFSARFRFAFGFIYFLDFLSCWFFNLRVFPMLLVQFAFLLS